MPLFGRGRLRRDAAAAVEALDDCEMKLHGGELQVRIERGVTLPGISSPTLYRAVLWSGESGEVGQLMFSWYPETAPGADFVIQQLGLFLGMAEGLRRGMDLGGTIRFTRNSFQPRGWSVLEMDRGAIPPDLQQLQLIVREP